MRQYSAGVSKPRLFCRMHTAVLDCANGYQKENDGRGQQPASLIDEPSSMRAKLETRCTCGIAGGWTVLRFFSIHLANLGIMWSLCVSVGLRTENHFRTINVQWIGQWGLFSRCSSS